MIKLDKEQIVIMHKITERKRGYTVWQKIELLQSKM